MAVMAASATTEHTATLLREKWRSPDSNFCILQLEDGTSAKGDARFDDLTPGLPYRFFGSWDTAQSKYGKTFKFTGFTKAEPHSRHGIITYLKRYTQGIGPTIAGLLYDAFGTDAVKELRNNPERATAEVNRLSRRHVLSEEIAHGASIALKELSLLEDTRIELSNLLAGRGFPGALSEELIRRWGPLAPVRIRRDPLSLLVLGLPGCGFTRCDKLYCDLGLPPDRLKRQLLCIWRALKDDNGGHTWQSLAWCDSQLKRSIAGSAVLLNRAVKLGLRARWLAMHVDDKGVRWIAQAEAAEQERTVVEAVAALAAWKLPEVCEGDKATPAEYDQWLALKTSRGREWTPKMVEILAPMPGEALTKDELLTIGRETGKCQFCGLALVSPESLARGAGPVCWAKVSGGVM